MEVATEMAASQAIEMVNMAGLGAGMLAIKDLSDYRHFVDYNNLEKEQVNIVPLNVGEQNSINDFNNRSLVSQLQQKYKEM